MTKTLTEQWAIITPENCQEINTMISGYKKQIERLQEQLKEANEIIGKCAIYCSVGCYYDERDEEMALDSKQYLKKWDVK